MNRLTSAEIAEALKPHYIETAYGLIGLKRISSTAFLECQHLFARPDAELRDPMKVGFRDAPCAACSAPRGQECESLAGESLPHEVRIVQSIEARSLRGIRAVMRAAIVDPQPDEAFFRFVEPNAAGFKELGVKVLDYQGLTEKARDQITETFREGAVGPEAGNVQAPDSGAAPAAVPDCA